MNEWMEGWMNEWMNEWMDGRMDEYNEWRSEWVNEYEWILFQNNDEQNYLNGIPQCIAKDEESSGVFKPLFTEKGVSILQSRLPPSLLCEVVAEEGRHLCVSQRPVTVIIRIYVRYKICVYIRCVYIFIFIIIYCSVKKRDKES